MSLSIAAVSDCAKWAYRHKPSKCTKRERERERHTHTHTHTHMCTQRVYTLEPELTNASLETGVDRKKEKEASCGVGETHLQELKRGWRRTLVSDFQEGDNGLEMVVGLANYHMLVYRDRQM
jgi:hypothetical protein